MSIDRYVCRTFQERVDSKIISDRINPKTFEGYSDKIKEFFERLFSVMQAQPYSIAMIDGALKGTPAEYSQFNSFKDPNFAVTNHLAFTFIPYSSTVVPTSPLIQIIRHDRLYLGESQEFIKQGDLQCSLELYYEDSRSAYSVNKDLSTSPTFNVLGRRPVEPEGLPLALIQRTLGEIQIITMFPPTSNSPFYFLCTPFFLVGKHENDDCDRIKEFLKMKKLKFSRLPKRSEKTKLKS